MEQVHIETYFSSLNATKNAIAEVRKSYNPVMAFGFNSFDFFWLNENKTSEVLAYFLNPNENHGQGSLFLELFLESIDRQDIWEIILSKSISVVCEKSTEEQRRIDILIKAGNNDFAVGIENKIYKNTQDQKNQLADYNKQLQAWASENYLLIYLAPKGKEISEGSISKDKRTELARSKNFIPINYEDDIIPLVRSWHINCQAVRVKSFLQDFEQYFKNQYTGEKFMNEAETLVKHALKTDNAEITLSLIQNSEAIYTALLEQLKQQMQSYALEKKYGFSWKINRNKKWSNFKMMIPETEALGLDITFEFENKYSNEFYFGYSLKEADKKLSPDTHQKLKQLFVAEFKSNEKPSATWPCWAYFEHRYWQPSTFQLIVNGEMQKKMIARIEELIKIAKAV